LSQIELASLQSLDSATERNLSMSSSRKRCNSPSCKDRNITGRGDVGKSLRSKDNTPGSIPASRWARCTPLSTAPPARRQAPGVCTRRRNSRCSGGTTRSSHPSDPRSFTVNHPLRWRQLQQVTPQVARFSEMAPKAGPRRAHPCTLVYNQTSRVFASRSSAPSQ